jgi:hypothetical protein
MPEIFETCDRPAFGNRVELSSGAALTRAYKSLPATTDGRTLVCATAGRWVTGGEYGVDGCVAPQMTATFRLFAAAPAIDDQFGSVALIKVN